MHLHVPYAMLQAEARSLLHRRSRSPGQMDGPGPLPSPGAGPGSSRLESLDFEPVEGAVYRSEAALHSSWDALAYVSLKWSTCFFIGEPAGAGRKGVGPKRRKETVHAGRHGALFSRVEGLRVQASRKGMGSGMPACLPGPDLATAAAS
jgi:hypothetical protein